MALVQVVNETGLDWPPPEQLAARFPWNPVTGVDAEAAGVRGEGARLGPDTTTFAFHCRHPLTGMEV